MQYAVSRLFCEIQLIVSIKMAFIITESSHLRIVNRTRKAAIDFEDPK